MVYTSLETDPEVSSESNYGWIEIEGGEIRYIGLESLLEGNMLWSKEFNSEANLEEYMSEVSKCWPNLYKKVESCFKEVQLPIIEKERHIDIKRRILKLEEEIVDLRNQLEI